LCFKTFFRIRSRIRKNINDIDWNDKIGNFDDVDDMCNEFTKAFLEIARDCILTKEIIVRENDKPWFNNTLRKEK
jgi:hypothetical protein